MADDRARTRTRSRPSREGEERGGTESGAQMEGRGTRARADNGETRDRGGDRDRMERGDAGKRKDGEDRGDRRDRGGRGDARQDQRIPSVRLVETAKKELANLIGREVDSASALVDRDGGWCVTVEMVELERIPPTTSLLGSYEVRLDEHGEVIGFERVRRYTRSDADG